MNTQNYHNVITFPDGKPYQMTNANALIFSLSSMTSALTDMEDIFKQILNNMTKEDHEIN